MQFFLWLSILLPHQASEDILEQMRSLPDYEKNTKSHLLSIAITACYVISIVYLDDSIS